tara:strand:- start:380 stop:778 length:399 start_codon:yes stop_codon:yes gene_type:complete
MALAPLILRSAAVSAAKKYGPKLVKEAKKHYKDLTTPKTAGQSKIEKATKSQRATRDTARKAVAGGAVAGAVAGSSTKNKSKDNRVDPKAYPTYKKQSKPAKSFREAFSEAKKKKQKTFTWEGRKYNTKEKK